MCQNEKIIGLGNYIYSQIQGMVWYSIYSMKVYFCVFFKKLLLFLILIQGAMFTDFRERERDRERDRDRLPSIRAPTRDQTHNLVLCPDLESNPQTFVAWCDALTN